MSQELANQLNIYGLSNEQSTVYIALLCNGPKTALELARLTKISRTQIYRILDELKDSQLVDYDSSLSTSIFEAMPPSNLEAKVVAKETEALLMKSSLNETYAMLKSLAGNNPHIKSKTLHYQGIEGLKQVNWNMTKAVGEYRVFEVSHLSSFLDKKFAERCRQRTMDQKIKSYDLTNNPNIYKKDLEPVSLDLASYRYINPKILDIKFEMYVYNDVVTLVDYSSDEIFALEIYHQTLADMQKQIHRALWSLAQPIIIK
jgi:sugar-specific transcriptional regulator TrmB